MKVLWIVNMLLPDLSNTLGLKTIRRSGTWLDNWLSEIRKNKEQITLAVACIYGTLYQRFDVDDIIYYTIPGNSKSTLFLDMSLKQYWEKIEMEFCPDIVHVHGTEYTHSLPYIRNFKNKCYVLSVQGLLGPIEREYFGGLPSYYFFIYRTKKEVLKFSGAFFLKLLYKHNIRYENEIIQNMDACIGRYDFDKYYVTSINADIKYYRCFYSLRNEFYYSRKWDIDKADKYTVYAGSSATSAFKSGHMLLNAITIVKRRYPKVKIVFVDAGDNTHNIKIRNGYMKYINKLIKRLGLVHNIDFYPALNADEVIELMLHSRCAVIPSAMDNGSTTLREAMHLGVPSIAAFRGGLTGLIHDSVDGFLYDYNEISFLAGRIIDLIENDEIAKKISYNAIQSSQIWHDKKRNAGKLLEIYNQISTIS